MLIQRLGYLNLKGKYVSEDASLRAILKIIDRVKNLFKLSQGEYVAPDKVQNILVGSKYINQIYLDGQSQYNYAITLIYPELK